LFHPTEKFSLIPDSDAVDSLMPLNQELMQCPGDFIQALSVRTYMIIDWILLVPLKNRKPVLMGMSTISSSFCPYISPLGSMMPICKPVIGDFHIFSNGWLGSKEQCRPGSFP
jgi:hypothetical protein